VWGGTLPKLPGPSALVLAALALGALAVLVAVWRLAGAVRRWRDQAAADRRREEDESRDWLDTAERRRRRPGE